MSEAYRVPTVPVEVEILMEDGRREAVVLYLSTVSETHSGPETLDEFLDKDRSFIGARSKESGQSFILNRDALVLVEAPASAPARLKREEMVASAIELVRIQLSRGSVVEGTLLMTVPPEQARISDYLNQKESFVAVDAGERILYVNKRHAVSVTF
jgi:hypothetical protein